MREGDTGRQKGGTVRLEGWRVRRTENGRVRPSDGHTTLRKAGRGKWEGAEERGSLETGRHAENPKFSMCMRASALSVRVCVYACAVKQQS